MEPKTDSLDDVAFPAEAITPLDRLRFLWRVQQRLIDQHNAVAPALSGRSLHGFKGDWHRRLLLVHRGVNQLRQTLAGQFPRSDGDDHEPAFDAKLAARQSTEWDSSLVAHPLLQAVQVDANPVDPLQDYTTYTEVDPNSHVTVAANTITVQAYNNEDAYVYRDFGSGYFGNYTHQFEGTVTGRLNNLAVVGGAWAIGTNVEDLNHQADVSFWMPYYTGSAYASILRHTKVGVTQATDTSLALTQNTKYYITATRTGSTVTLTIYTDSNRTVVLDTMTIDDDGVARRYMYAFCTRNTGTAGAIYLTIENLDLGTSVVPMEPYYRRLRG